MTKNAMYLKLVDLIGRVRMVAHNGKLEVGWELLELEKALIGLENDVAEQVDTFMANEYRKYNVAQDERVKNEDVTRVPRRYGPRSSSTVVGTRIGTRH